jgi:hypothetical protein
LTVKLSADGTIELEGRCTLEDAEVLQRELLAHAGATVDWRACHAAHTAVVQVLIAARPPIVGPPASDFLRMHVEPLLSASSNVGPGAR